MKLTTLYLGEERSGDRILKNLYKSKLLKDYFKKYMKNIYFI